MSEKAAASPRVSSYLLYILTALVLAVVVYVRVRLLAVPLERDEGEYAYMGQLLLKGYPPFTHAYTMKLPGVSILYALFMVMFGQSVAGIHLGLLIVNALCVVLLYLITKKLFDRNSALVSCATYAVLSLSQSVLGIFAHATHFVALFSLAGFLIILSAIDSRRSYLQFASGLCFGLAISMKQHAVFLMLFALSYQAWHIRRSQKPDKKMIVSGTVIFLSGTITPVVLILLWVASTGMLGEFWLWTVQYAREYASGNTLLEGAKFFYSGFLPLLSVQPMLWLCATIGVGLLCTKYGRCIDRSFIFGLLICSFLSICPGLIFRNHYFVLVLPAAAILVGVAVSTAMRHFPLSQSPVLRQSVPLVLWMIAVASGMFIERQYLFTSSPLEVSRSIDGANPFPEAVQVARYLKDHTTASDKIAVLGSEPEIFFYADRLSATGHIYMYGLMENHPFAEQMQMQMIQDIEQARPKYIVYVNVNASWLVRPSSKRTVLLWGENYVQKYYELVGVVDLINPATIRYLWDAEVTGYAPVSEQFLNIFKRKAGA